MTTRQTEKPVIVSDFGDDPDMAELVSEFVSGLPQQIADLQAAFTAGDTETVTRLAHSLAGAGGGYGFRPITDQARIVEMEQRDSASPESIRASIEALADICDRARRGIESNA
ncbi:MAG: Hpt domain-containing protein [Planctomycetota bacterium]